MRRRHPKGGASARYALFEAAGAESVRLDMHLPMPRKEASRLAAALRLRTGRKIYTRRVATANETGR